LQLFARKYKMSDSDKWRSKSNEVPDSSVPDVGEYRATGQTVPNNLPLFLTSVWQCESTEQADAILDGAQSGFVYQRESHPNANQFAKACRTLHKAKHATVTSSGMAALSLAVLSQLEQGDHVVVCNRLYGRSIVLLGGELQRLGIQHSLVDSCDLQAVEDAMTDNTRLIVAETISNPILRIADIKALAEIAHSGDAQLLVDNTFATPIVCQPLELGADLVLESVSKFMNGHGDIMLGMLAGNHDDWERVESVNSTWGLASSPLECWLACRGVATLALRISRACESALTVAEYLTEHDAVERVVYPGLESHDDFQLAQRQFIQGSGHVVTFQMTGGRTAADQVMASPALAFCPSLGDVTTTISHPLSTSHRGLSLEQQQQLGVNGATIRLSVGIEESDSILERLQMALER
jgi:cystathionine beta-lyase/cystathionine gamma-synthase